MFSQILKFRGKGWKVASALAVTSAAVALTVPAVKSQGTPTIKIDGSSTVYPITEAVAEEFQNSKRGAVRVTVGISGTGGGFKKFCSTNASVRTDISDASRPMKDKEQAACKAAGIEYIELPVAYDAITVVVNPQNNAVNDMTVEELKKMWDSSAQGNVTKWSQIRAGWPDVPFTLFGPGADSGTFDYFNEVIIGKGNSSRSDYTPSEDDNVLVQGVSSNPNALGYFGFAYYKENTSRLKAVKIGGVAPSTETVNNGSYSPLSRPIYIYVNKASAEKPEVREFVQYYLNNTNRLVPEVGYVALPESDYSNAMSRFNNRQVGRVPLRAGL